MFGIDSPCGKQRYSTVDFYSVDILWEDMIGEIATILYILGTYK